MKYTQLDIKVYFIIMWIYILSYRPTPTITWTRQGNKDMPTGRFKYGHYQSTLTIHNIQKSDEGEYECKGTNTVNSLSYIIRVEILGRFSYH